jgi:glycosyltransferase involved in cell wall biosynthesis
MRYTVVTATYNRAKTLPRVYDALCRQTYGEPFEWLVVDDGSDDQTRELIEGWRGEGKLGSVRYFYKENGGKHSAWRVALDEISTPYVVELDSDDELTEDALAIFDRHWRRLEARGDAERFVDIRALCRKPDGSPLTPHRFPEDAWEANLFELIFERRMFFEQCACWHTDRLRDGAPIPEHFAYDDRAKNFLEGIRWARAARKYDTLFINEVVRVYHVDGENSYCRGFNLHNHDRFFNNIVGDLYFVEENIDHFRKWPTYFLKAMVRYSSNSLLVGTSPPKQLADWGKTETRALWLATLPAAVGAYLVKRGLIAAGRPDLLDW